MRGFRWAVLAAGLLVLAACGGGRGGHPAPSQTATPSPEVLVAQPVTATPIGPTTTATHPPPTPRPSPTRRPSATPTPTPSPFPSPSPTPSPQPTPTPTPKTLSLREGTWEVAAYPFASHLQRVPSEVAPGFTFLRLDWDAYEGADPQPAPTAFPSLVLENPWLRAAVVPGLGGRVAELTYKPTGHDELYRNPVLKPTRWGPPEQGWWLAAGGMEWCLPVPEHGYLWAETWPARTVDGAEAIAAVVESPPGPPLSVQVAVRLPVDEAALHLAFRIRNQADRSISFAYWTNAMLAPGAGSHPSEGLRFLLPADEVQVHSTGDPRLPGPGQRASWPVWNGIALDRPTAWEGWLGIFAVPRAREGWAAVYDLGADEGVVRIFPAEVVPGIKAFAFGQGPGSPASRAWTDDGSAYVELQGGLAPTFGDRTALGPGEEVAWEEVWYPVAGLGNLVHAGRHAALGLAQGQDGPVLLLHTLRPVRGVLVLAGPGGEVLLRHEGEAAPGAPLEVPIRGMSRPAPAEVRLLDENGKTLYTCAWESVWQEGYGTR